MTIEDIWGPNTEPPRQEWPPLAVHCPHCQAYLMTLGLVGPMACEMCGGAFEIPEEATGGQP